ncbi:MAG: hypothetical protein IJO64_03325 [Clostridia bacterium]|nr:hypothetical protein [Clostridia bacterium]
MQKRKFKLNILDIAIFVAVICAIATLVFRDTIHEAFSEPEIGTLSLTAHASNADESLKAEFENQTAEFFVNNGNGGTISVPITKLELSGETNGAVISFTCRGYKKLGRFYTENGERLSIEGECKFTVGEKTLSCVIDSVSVS